MKYQPMRPMMMTASTMTAIITGLLTSWLPNQLTSSPASVIRR
jgi:hypothetical protein